MAARVRVLDEFQPGDDPRQGRPSAAPPDRQLSTSLSALRRRDDKEALHAKANGSSFVIKRFNPIVHIGNLIVVPPTEQGCNRLFS